MWNPKVVEYHLLHTQRQMIYGFVKVRSSGMMFDLSMVYGLHTLIERKDMWHELRQTGRRYTQLWLVIGDFNLILHIEDSLVGSQVQETELKDFKQCLLDIGLIEMKTTGRNYTWTNGNTYSRIDKALVNAIWMRTLTHMECKIFDPSFSDHSPLCVIVVEEENTGSKPFRFFNYLADHPDFMKIVKSNWTSQRQASSMADVWEKIKRLKQLMRRLSNHDLQGIQTKVSMIRNQLKELQEQIRWAQNQKLIKQYQIEKDLKVKLEKWRNIKCN